MTTENQVNTDSEWLNDLTPYESETQQTVAQQTTVSQVQQEESKQEEAARQDYEYIDTDAANELVSKEINPRMKDMQRRIAELEAQLTSTTTSQTQALRMATNSRLVKQIPQAEKILNSKEFAAFMQQQDTPYTMDSAFNQLLRAYNAGDVDYVVNQIEKFRDHHKKQKVTPSPERGTSKDGFITINTNGSNGSENVLADFAAERRKRILGVRAARTGGKPIKEFATKVMSALQDKYGLNNR